MQTTRSSIDLATLALTGTVTAGTAVEFSVDVKSPDNGGRAYGIVVVNGKGEPMEVEWSCVGCQWLDGFEPSQSDLAALHSAARRLVRLQKRSAR